MNNSLDKVEGAFAELTNAIDDAIYDAAENENDKAERFLNSIMKLIEEFHGKFQAFASKMNRPDDPAFDPHHP